MRTKKMDQRMGQRNAFPWGMVPQREELSTQGDMPMREADPSVFGFLVEQTTG